MKKLILLTITLSALTSQNWATETWTTFDVPGAKMTGVSYVKDNIIAGSYYDYSNWNGFIYDGTTLTTINRHGYDGTQIHDIEGNNILGWSYTSGSDTGFLYDGTTWTDIEMPGADRSVPNGIDNGNIVGHYFPNPGNEIHGYLFDGSSWTSLDFPGGSDTVIYDLDCNNMVGCYKDEFGVRNGFLFDGTTWKTLNMPGAESTRATGIYGNLIVGRCFSYSDMHTYSFLYDGINWTTLDIGIAGSNTYVDGVIDNKVFGTYSVDNQQHGFIYEIPGPQTYYVDTDAPGDNNGSSWTDAFNHLQDALAAAQSGDEIWVAQGTYTPDSNSANPGGTGDRQATFQLKNGVAVKGGYTGYGEPDPNARDIELYETILSGDLDGNDNDGPDFVNYWENSYHVVTGSGTDATAVLDGFTITAGNADDLSNCPDCHTAGAGMFNKNASPTIANCTFRENFVGNDADLSWCGAGMYNYQSNPTLTNCTFRGNSIVAPDGATGGGMFNKYSSPTLTECSFIANSASEIGDGGGMYNLSESSPKLTDCTFSGNLGRHGGGMGNSWDSTPILINCTFTGNSSTIRGGGIANWQTGQGPTLTDCIFSGNSSDHGGGIYNGNNSSLTVTGCTFTENTADGGGGIYNDQSSPMLSDCTFDENEAGVGGGMYNYQSSPTLNDCTFRSGNDAGSGGGMYNDQSSPTLSNCTFSNNRAICGGGMYNKDSSLILIDCTFNGNWTNLDGAGMSNKDSSLILTNCMFDDNRTDDGSGGGMYNSGGSLTVTGCTFINNDTMWDGGGIRNSGVNSTLTNCIFAGNFYAYHGGGLSNSRGSTVLTNCAFTGNLAEYGGGMYNWSGSSATLRNCKFSGNSAINNGGGIGNSSDYNLTMSNCIVWGNTPDEIYGGAGIPVVNYSDVQGGWPGMGNIDIDPQFVDPCSANYHLLPGSPCIDTGDPAYVPGPNETDLDGNPRVTGGRIDMGAYEANYIQARLWFLPRTINRQSKMKRVMAWVQLPEGITKDQIDQTTPLLLYPGPLEPIKQYIFEHGQKGRKRTSIFLLYDKGELMSAVPDNGRVDVQVVGMLTTSQYFYGTDFINIVDRQQPRQWQLLKKK